MAARKSIRLALQSERRRLQRALAVLDCFMMAWDLGRPDCAFDYGDVAEVAREQIARALEGLDSARLRLPPP